MKIHRTFRTSVALLILGALSLSALAQTANPQQPTGNQQRPTTTAQPDANQRNMNQQTEEFRRQAPPPLAPRTLNIPTPYETTLPNGLQVVIVEQPRLPLVNFRLAFRVGDAHDPREIPGLMDMVSGTLTEGTQSRTSRQIADQVARLGATLSASANADYTTVGASALAAYSDQILDLMADVVLRPIFPEEELARARANTKQGLLLQRGQAGFLANERVSRVLFGDHPYSVIAPSPEGVDAMTRERVTSYHRSTFVPNNAVLVVVGDVQREAIMRRLNELFGRWERGQTQEARFPSPPARTARAIYLVDRPGSAQSNIVIANTGLTRTSPDYFPTLVMHTILGGTASARLFMNLREEKGYTYGAYTNLDARRDVGSFRATAEVRSEVTGASLREFFHELERIRNEMVTERDLTNAKAYLTGVFPIRLETQEGLIDQLVQIKMYNLPANYLQTYRDRVNAITREDVQRAARQYVTPDRVAIVIVGDAARIMDQIRPYSQTIEVYEASGARRATPAATTTPATTSGATTPATGAAATATTPAAFAGEGTWAIEFTMPGGQSAPATLTLRRDGDKWVGVVTSQLGETQLTNITITGNSFEGPATLNFQGGQPMEARFAGRIEGDRISGNLTLSLPNAPPIPFTGTRRP